MGSLLRFPERCWKRWLLVCAATCLLLSGCGTKLHEVSGVVTLDGQPVAEAGVMFQPTAGGPVASGTTDAAGKFTLQCANKPGLIAGEYLVTISKVRITCTPSCMKALWP